MPADAFALSEVQSPTTGQWFPAYWPEATGKVRFALNDSPLELLPNLARGSDAMAAISEAMRAWDFAPVGLRVGGPTTETDAGKDGENLITFADTPHNRDLVGDFRALTFTWYGRQESSTTV